MAIMAVAHFWLAWVLFPNLYRPRQHKIFCFNTIFCVDVYAEV